MKISKGLIVFALMLSAGCQSFRNKSDDSNKQSESSQANTSSMYDLPSAVDLDKAARLNVELGMGYLQQNNYPRAKSKLLRSIELGPNLPEVNYAWAYYLEKVGEVADAEKFYQQAIRIDVKNGKSHNNYGAFLCRHGRYQESEKSFLTALEDPTYAKTAEVLENAGYCVMQIPDYAKAEAYFERALKHDPNRYDSLLELAILKYKHNQVELAQSYYNTYSKLAQPTKRSLLLGLKLAVISGDQDKEASIRMLLESRYPGQNPSL